MYLPLSYPKVFIACFASYAYGLSPKPNTKFVSLGDENSIRADLDPVGEKVAWLLMKSTTF